MQRMHPDDALQPHDSSSLLFLMPLFQDDVFLGLLGFHRFLLSLFLSSVCCTASLTSTVSRQRHVLGIFPLALHTRFNRRRSPRLPRNPSQGSHPSKVPTGRCTGTSKQLFQGRKTCIQEHHFQEQHKSAIPDHFPFVSPAQPPLAFLPLRHRPALNAEAWRAVARPRPRTRDMPSSQPPAGLQKQPETKRTPRAEGC